MQKCGILLTMSLTNTHYCDILSYMSINAHFNQNPQNSTQKMPKAFFATSQRQATSDKRQAHPNNHARTGEGVHGQMRHGERTNKIPTYEKKLQSESDKQYTHLLTNRVNKPIAYIPIIFISSHFPIQYCPYRLYIDCRADIKRRRRFEMKKKVLMSLVLLTLIGTSAVFAQSKEKYYLEIYNISEATAKTLDSKKNDPKFMREDDYFFVRTASGTTLRSKDNGLSLEQVKQKIMEIAPGNTTLVRWINDFTSTAQQKWGVGGAAYSTGSPRFFVYAWIRRTE
jgi:hypothetical protein